MPGLNCFKQIKDVFPKLYDKYAKAIENEPSADVQRVLGIYMARTEHASVQTRLTDLRIKLGLPKEIISNETYLDAKEKIEQEQVVKSKAAGVAISFSELEIDTLKESIQVTPSLDIPFDVNGEPTMEWVEQQLAAPIPAKSYTFPDGHKIDSPFDFTQDQIKTFDKLYRWYVLGEKEGTLADTILIQGNAGTGKSSTIGFFMQYLIETGRIDPDQIGFSSPTHKANKVLFKFAMKIKAFKKNVFKGAKKEYDEQVFTTAAAFGVKISITNRQGMKVGGTEQKQKGYSKLSGSKYIRKKKVWIVDEISMLDSASKLGMQSMVEAIQYYNDVEGIKIIMMGDDKQLTSQETGKVSPFFRLPNRSELREEVRQSKTNPLLETLGPLKEALDNKEKLDGLPNYTSNVNEQGEGVIFAQDMSLPLLSLFTSEEYQGDRTHTKVIALSNKSVMNYNERIRNHIFQSPRNLEVNDTMMGYQQVGKAGSNGVQNGQEYVIKSIERNKEFNIKNTLELQVVAFPSTLKPLAREIVKNLPDGTAIGDYVTLEEDNPIFATTIETYILDANTDFHLSKIDHAAQVYSELVNGHVAAQKDLNALPFGSTRRFEFLDRMTAYELLLQGFASQIQFKTPLYKDTTTGEVRSEQNVRDLTEAHYDANQGTIKVFKDKYVDTVLAKRVFIDKTIDYGYAITVTKSQGSTYKYPIVDLNSIEGKNNYWYKEDNENTLRTLYVAESRASKIAINITSKGDTKDVVIPKSKDAAPAAPVIQTPAPVIIKVEEPLVDEPGVYKQFGTSYRFNAEGTAGEYRQGNGVWKKMADKTARAKYKELVPQKEEPIVDEAPAVNAEAATYTGKITELKPNEVFVFGSNPIGVNGNPSKGTGGAALVAFNIAGVKQGEKMDNKLSDSGKAWGITTVSGPGKKRSKTVSEITEGIQKLYKHATANPDKRFLVAYQGVTGTNLNGYSNQELADMFSANPIPANVIFEQEFSTLLTEQVEEKEPVKPNTVENIIAALPDSPVEFMVKNTPEIQKLMAQQLVPKTDGTYFSPSEHTEIIRTIATITERKLRANPELKANALLSTFTEMKKRAAVHKQLGNATLAMIFESIDTQRGRLLEDTIREMGSMGLTIDGKTKAGMIEAVNKNIILEAKENGEFALMNPEIEEEQEEFTDDFLESVGRISKDWSQNSFELNPSDTASAKIKQFMSTLLEMDRGIYNTSEDGVKISESINLEELLTNKVKGQRLAREISRKPFWFKDAASSKSLKEFMDTNYPSFPKENFMSLPKTADFQQVFKETLMLLGNNLQSSTFEDFMSTLKSYPNPTLQAMAQGLEKADQSLKNQFMTVMMKQYQPFTFFAFARSVNPKTGVEFYTHKLSNANLFNQKGVLVDFWKEQQKLQEIMIDSPTGERVLDVDLIKSRWVEVLKDAIAVSTSQGEQWADPKNKEWIVEQMGVIFRKSGIGVTNEMMTEYFKNPAKYGKSSSIAQLFSIKEDGTPGGFLSAFILKSAGMNTLQDESDTATRTEYAKENNPVLKEDLGGLATLVAKYTPVMYSNNHKNVEGKNVWDWGMNTKLSHEFRQMSQQFAAFVESKKNVLITKENWLINHFSENPALIEGMSMGYLDGMKKDGAKKGTNRQNMSDREQLLQSAALFQNRGGGFNQKSRVSYMSQTHGDKIMSPIFHGMPRINAGVRNYIPNTLVGNTDSLMFNVFKAEFDRIHSTVEQNNKQYNKGRKLFFFIPEFNHEVMQKMVADGFLTQNEFELIWPAGQPTLTESIDSEMELPVINKILEKVVEDRTNNTLAAWKREGLVSDYGHLFDSTYMAKIAQLAGLKSEPKANRQKEDLDTLIYKSESNGDAVYDHKTGNSILAYTAARDYAVNQFLFNTALSQLFYGDPAEAYKENKKDKSVMGTVQSTFAQYTKRLAKDIAPRADLYWDKNKKNYNVITIADVNTKEKYLSEAVPIYALEDTKSTDGQELTTVQEKLDVMYANGGSISTKVYDEMTAIVTAGKGGYYEFVKPEHIAIVMQPEKPVYAGAIVHGDANLTNYIKSSAWALYPPMTRGKEVDKFRIMLETKGFQRAHFESTQKMGNPNQALVLFDENQKYIEPTDEAIQAATSVLNRDNFGIQQDVPYDADKAAIGILTQMNENITEGLMEMDEFVLPDGRTMNGVEIKKYKEDIRKEMIGYQVKQLDRKWNIDSRGNLDFEHMLNMMANEAKNDPRSSYTVNEIQQLLLRGKDGLLSIPLMFGSAADKYERMLHSQINQIVQIKMPGKSFVQASPVGWTFSEGADLSKVVRIGDWDGSPLKTMRPDPNNPKKSLPAQVILPFNFVDNEGNRLNVEDFLKKNEDGTLSNQLDMDRVPIELLQAVGARIPNQKHSSMLPLEIVGFTDPALGDLAIIPQATLKQMGSDFDVDKLYTYRLPYKHNAETNSFEQIKNDKGRTKESMQRDYFNIHWSILTHPDMLERVLSPLDKADLADEADELKAPPVENYNYFDVISQLEDFQRGKEAKTIVGVTSWGLKNDARIQDKNVRFGNGEYNPLTKQLIISDDFIYVKDDITNETKKLGRLSGNGKSFYLNKKNMRKLATAVTAKDKADIMKAAMRSKGDNHVMLGSEALDNMNNRNLDNLNVTVDTYKAIQAFIQLQDGDDWAAHAGYWTKLVTQPIIFEFSKMMKQGNDSLSAEFDDNLYQSTVNTLESKYREMLEGEQDTERAEGILMEPDLMMRMHEMDGNDFALHQLAALKLFKQLYSIGDKMFKVEALFNQDVSGGGISLFTTLQKAEDLKGLKDPNTQLPLRGAYAIYDGTEAGAVFDATIGKANATITQLFPYHMFMPILGRIMTMTGKNKMSVDTQFRALSAYRSMVFSSGKAWWTDTQATRARLIYGKESLAHRLAELQSTPEGQENPFVQGLRTEIANNDQQGSYVTYRAAGMATPNERHNMSAGWLRLLLSDDPTMVTLGEDLIRYTYLTGGVQDANSFVQFVPTSFIANTPFSDRLREAEKQLSEGVGLSSDAFIIQYLQHNPSTARNIKKADLGKHDGDFPETFFSDKLKEDVYSYYSKEQGKFVLYLKNGNTETGFKYTRIDTLGNKFTDEYDGDASGGIRSVLVENRSVAENIPGLVNGNPLDSLIDLKNNSFSSFNEGVSGFDQLGIKDGGEKEFMNGLDAIRNNTSVPQYVRETANLLHRVQESPESKAASILTGALGKPITVSTTEDTSFAGQVDFNNNLLINRQTEGSLKSAAVTFAHEAIHLKLQSTILAAGGDTRILDKNPATTKYFKALIEGYRTKFPEVAKHVDALERIRYEAYNAFRNSVGEERFNEILAEVNQGDVVTDEHKLLYSLSNLQELVAHLTTEPILMEHLNSIESGRGTLLSRIWDALMDMISAIARAAGVKVERDSLLYEALVHTMKLTDMEGTRDVNITQSLLMPNSSFTKTDTEGEADMLNSLFNHTYNRETTTVKTPVAFEITLTNNKYTSKTKIVPGQRGKVIAKLEEQKKQLQIAQNAHGLDTAKRTELFIQIKEVKEAISLLNRENDLDNITKIAKAQLVWVDKVLAMDNPSPMDINIASKAAGIWENIFDTLYEQNTEEHNTDFEAFSSAAKHKRQRLSNMHSLTALDPVIGGRGVTINQSVLTAKNLEDISAVEANALTLTRTKSILVQATANYAWQQANNRDEDIGRNALELQDLDAEMKEANMTGEMLVDDANGEWRLINRVSGNWFGEVKKIRYALDITLKSLNDVKISDADRKERVTKAWDNYWKAMKRTAVFVDSRVFFDINTGEKVSGSKYDTALEELTAKVGDKAHAEILIAEAQAKYKEYLIQRDAQKDYIDANTFTSEEYMEGKTDDEIAAMTEKKKESLYNTWLAFNSPLKLLEKINSDKEIGYESHGTEFLTSSPMATNKAAFNDKFKAIAEDPKKLAVYNKIKEKLKEMISYLPMDIQADISEESYLPFVPKDTASFLSRAMDGIRNWNTVLLKELTATDAEEASRLKPNEIPVMYARASGYTKEAENRSKDIVQILSLFSMMALQHKYMGKALDVINVTEGIIKEVNKQRIESPDSGKPIRYLSDSLKYFKDTLVFKKPKELEWKVGNKIYNINPAEQSKIVKEIDALVKEKQELTDKESARWASMDFTDSPNKERINEIDKKLNEYEKDARYIYGSKIVDKLISINQLKALAFNPVSAVSNFTFGVMSVSIHARGRIDYTPAQAREAWAIMSHASKKYWMFNSVGDDTAQKIHSLMLRTNIMGDITDTAYGESNIKTRKGNPVISALHPFNWQKSGDYFAKGVFMIAMMKNKMIEITDKITGEKKMMSLWDASGKDGQLDQKYEAQEEWYSADISKQTQWNNYRDRMRKVGVMVFGNQDKNSPLMMKKTALWRLVAQFRLSWFPEGIATRWKAEYEDQVLERTVKGRWRTYGDLGWLGSSMVLAKQLINAIPGIKVDAFKDVTLRYSDGTVKSLEDSEVDMENMRKNFSGLAMTVSITAMILMLESLQSGDDEHKKNAKARQRTLLLNLLVRNQQDLMLYSSPSVFNTISGNALPALSVITDYYKAMKGTAHYFFGDTKHEKDAVEKMMKKWMRATPVLNLEPKMETFFTRNISDLER